MPGLVGIGHFLKNKNWILPWSLKCFSKSESFQWRSPLWEAEAPEMGWPDARSETRPSPMLVLRVLMERIKSDEHFKANSSASIQHLPAPWEDTRKIRWEVGSGWIGAAKIERVKIIIIINDFHRMLQNIKQVSSYELFLPRALSAPISIGPMDDRVWSRNRLFSKDVQSICTYSRVLYQPSPVIDIQTKIIM